MKRTPHQDMLLQKVAESDDVYRAAKINAKARAREIAAQELAQYSAHRDLMARLAFDGKVPKRHISEIGLHTTSPATLDEILARTAESARIAAEAAQADPLAERYSIDADEDENLLVITVEGQQGVFAIKTRADKSQYLALLDITRFDSAPARFIGQPTNEAEALAWFAEHAQ